MERKVRSTNGAWLKDGTKTLTVISYQLSIIKKRKSNYLIADRADFSKMKVLYFLDSLNQGGTETLALDVLRNAESCGLDLIVGAAGGGALEKEFLTTGAEFVRLRRRLPVDLNLVLKLRKIIRDRKIEIVHGHQAVDGLHLYLASMNLPVKRVLSFHGFVADKKNRQTLKFLIPRMDANIAVSRGLQNWLAEIDQLDTTKNFRVLYNGVDARRIQPTGKSLRAELNLSKDDLLFGMIGNFYRDPRKDQMTICRALPKVFAEIKNARCIFVGRTETGAEHKFQECVDFCRMHEIADRVHFLGERRDVPDILAALDFFVFSSLQEGLPIAAAEAMLARVPLIVSDIEPFLEVSANGEYAEVFPVQNHEILSDKILKFLKDKNLREDLGNRTFRYARENFSIEAHLRELKKLYHSIL